MLPLRDIYRWRTHAAWRTDAQVEQDLLITRAMAAIFADPFLSSQVAMRGGTVLHKIHLAPAARYSEDIDLVAVADRPSAHIRKALLRVLSPMLGSPLVNVVDSVRLAVRNVARPSQLIRLVYQYQPTAGPPPLAKLKVEVNVTEREPIFGLVHLPYHPPWPDIANSLEIISYDLDEILGTKMRALLQRDKGRDLFDLAHAWDRCGVSTTSGGNVDHSTTPFPTITPVRVAHAFNEYMRREGTTVTAAHFSDELARKLERASFRADLSDVLATDITYNVDAAAATVREAYIAHLGSGSR